MRASIHSRWRPWRRIWTWVLTRRGGLGFIDEREDPLLYSFALHNAARCKLFAGRGGDHDVVEGVCGCSARERPGRSACCLRTGRCIRRLRHGEGTFRGVGACVRDRGDEARCSVLLRIWRSRGLHRTLDRARVLSGEALDLATRPSRRRGSEWRCGPGARLPREGAT